MKKINLLLLSTATLLMLTGCSKNGFTDLSDWMENQKNNSKGKVVEIPDVKSFQAIEFIAKDDPFKEKTLANVVEMEKNKYAPDPNRRKEPLESYSLELIKMTGTLIKDKKTYAMIKTADGRISYLAVGNYVGVNYGKVISIDESKVSLEERVKEADEWKIKSSELLLEQ
jgi:type IV pilus assembly protein PilP